MSLSGTVTLDRPIQQDAGNRLAVLRLGHQAQEAQDFIRSTLGDKSSGPTSSLGTVDTANPLATTRQTLDQIQKGHVTQFLNAKPGENSESINAATRAEISRYQAPPEEPDEQQQSGGTPWLLGGVAIDTARRQVFNPHHHRHHPFRDLKRIGRLAKGAKTAEEIEREKRLAQEAKDGRNIEHEAKDIAKGEHALHDGEKGIVDADKILKEGRLGAEIVKAASLGKKLKLVAGGLTALGISGFVIKRFAEGQMIRTLAQDTHPDKADQWAQDVMFRPVLTKEAMVEWDKGNYTEAFKIQIKGTVDDFKGLATYLSNPDKVQKDFAEASDAFEALRKVYEKDPRKGNELALGVARDLNLFGEVALDKGMLSAQALHGALMGNSQEATQAMKGLGTTIAARPGERANLGSQLGTALDVAKDVKTQMEAPKHPASKVSSAPAAKQDNLG